MPGDPLVSCIVPAHNSERFVGEALDSVLTQRRVRPEVILVDDGSVDGTAAIAEAMAPRVRCVRQSTAGPAATRNTGIRAARGELIGFLDADDRWHPEKLQRQVAHFSRNPDLEVSVCLAKNFWMPEVEADAVRLQAHPRNQAVPGYISGAMLARRHVFDTVGLFDETLWFGDAADWFLRARRLQVRVEMLGEVLFFHRCHGANLTRRRRQDSEEEFLRIARASVNRWPPRRSGGT